ncbi:EF-hand calcium-binding domain-containing protein 1 [Fasciola gigantica]|uniref:EF-hand calcium-binding domain-containing protein 1 n=1 Tax=Fasciola gigantica TaxID=46835 RepID=A0A504YN84_FASGI|nr:EF-hand calcium-binding domain-containing protein 1 [Fasciola gigantica]
MNTSSSRFESSGRRPSWATLQQRFSHRAAQLEHSTSFSCIEIEGLLRIFDKIVDKYKSPMTKAVFKDVLFNFFGLTNDIMMEKIFRAMTNGSSIMTHDDWVQGMNIYLRGTLMQLANFAFTVYDQQKRDLLSKEDIQMYLRDILVVRLPEEDADECHTDMLDMVFVLLDRDKDGYISRKDFLKSVLAEPLLLQILGECLPPTNRALTLESLFKQVNGK